MGAKEGDGMDLRDELGFHCIWLLNGTEKRRMDMHSSSALSYSPGRAVIAPAIIARLIHVGRLRMLRD